MNRYLSGEDIELQDVWKDWFPMYHTQEMATLFNWMLNIIYSYLEKNSCIIGAWMFRMPRIGSLIGIDLNDPKNHNMDNYYIDINLDETFDALINFRKVNLFTPYK